MAKFSIDNWSFKLMGKYDSEMRIILKIILSLIFLGIIGFFVKIGFDYSASTEYSLFQTILYGVLIAVAVTILFICYHLWGGIDFDLKWFGFPVGLAVGGSVIGVVGGYNNNIISWTVGLIVGGVIIFVTAKYYWTRYKNSI